MRPVHGEQHVVVGLPSPRARVLGRDAEVRPTDHVPVADVDGGRHVDDDAGQVAQRFGGCEGLALGVDLVDRVGIVDAERAADSRRRLWRWAPPPSAVPRSAARMRM
jgi:hypothetical protein